MERVFGAGLLFTSAYSEAPGVIAVSHQKNSLEEKYLVKNYRRYLG